MDHTGIRLALRVGLPFAALAVGFVGAILYVPLALRPLMARAEVIQHELAESVLVLSDLRGHGRDVRMEALLAYQAQWDRSIERDARLRAMAAGSARLQAEAQTYARLPRSAEEDAIWRRVRDESLPGLRAAVTRLLAAYTRPGGDPGSVQDLLARSTVLDEQLRQLVHLNAQETQRDTARLHQAMDRLSVAYVLLAVLGALGAAVLLRQSLALLRRYRESVTRRVSELEAFAGQISHDLRTPLQAVQLAVATIDKVADDPPSVRRIAGRAMKGVRRLDGMIHDLLQFARSGAEVRGTARADVREIATELARELGPQADRAGVALVVHASPAQARITPIALRMILANLIENAIKYRRPEGENRVTVDAAPAGDHLRLRVGDTGVGIAPELLPRLFEPFVRGSRRPDSYGLGLATVRRLVDAHGGTISVRSEQGRGTEFTILLPLGLEPAVAEPIGALRRADKPAS